MMLLNLIILLISLGIILIGCELFTNGIEWLGKKLKLGDGVIGSIFSAVGTCLPETLIPVIALLFSNKQANSIDIGIGAIAGAPFMLSTLAFFVTGLSVVIFAGKRKNRFKLNVNANVIKRDLLFFIIVYSVGILVSFDVFYKIKNLAAIALVACYVFYVIRTVNSDRASNADIEDLIIARAFNTNTNYINIFLQIIMALAAIIVGAELFVKNIEIAAESLKVSTLVLSIIITPIATELPEKFNSVIWISKGKDTLSMGNITGAMVFQSCIPVSIGILATQWHLNTVTLISALLSLLSSLVAYIFIKTRKSLNPLPLLTGGLFYAVFICFLIVRGFN